MRRFGKNRPARAGIHPSFPVIESTYSPASCQPLRSAYSASSHVCAWWELVRCSLCSLSGRLQLSLLPPVCFASSNQCAGSVTSSPKNTTWVRRRLLSSLEPSGRLLKILAIEKHPAGIARRGDARNALLRCPAAALARGVAVCGSWPLFDVLTRA